MSESESKASFFRQSGWMVIATFVGGVMMFAVHIIANRQMSVKEYNEVFALLKFLNFLSIPAGGLITIFAHQGAGAVDDESRQRLTACARGVFGALIGLWLLMLAVVFVGQDRIMAYLQLERPTSLWATMAVALTTLLIPVARGLLQGRQRFGGLGWSMLLDGVIRFTAVVVILTTMSRSSVGVMGAALLGQCVAVGVGLWCVRDLLGSSPVKVDWRSWSRHAAPLILGSGVIVFFMTADAIFARSLFDEETFKYYGPGNMVGFAMAQFAVPVATVMFPKVVRSAATASKTDAMKWTLILTAAVGGCGALLATVAPWLPVKVMYKDAYAGAAPLVPWFAWSMLIFTLANVLVGNLLARSDFRAVKWLVLVAAFYGVTLVASKPSLAAMEPIDAYRRIVVTLMAFNALMLAIVGLYTWWNPARGLETKKAADADGR